MAGSNYTVVAVRPRGDDSLIVDENRIFTVSVSDYILNVTVFKQAVLSVTAMIGTSTTVQIL